MEGATSMFSCCLDDAVDGVRGLMRAPWSTKSSERARCLFHLNVLCADFVRALFRQLLEVLGVVMIGAGSTNRPTKSSLSLEGVSGKDGAKECCLSVSDGLRTTLVLVSSVMDEKDSEMFGVSDAMLWPR
jgi:hypothetical protein